MSGLIVTSMFPTRRTGLGAPPLVAMLGCAGVILPQYPPDFEGTVAALGEEIPFEGRNQPMDPDRRLRRR